MHNSRIINYLKKCIWMQISFPYWIFFCSQTAALTWYLIQSEPEEEIKVVRLTQQWINLPPKVDRMRKSRFSDPTINELFFLQKWTKRGLKDFRLTHLANEFCLKVDRKRKQGFLAHLKVSLIQNEFARSSFLSKCKPKITRISVLPNKQGS